MAVYLCHEFPDLYEHEATIIDAIPATKTTPTIVRMSRGVTASAP